MVKAHLRGKAGQNLLRKSKRWAKSAVRRERGFVLLQ
jgi:hypothetical protein